ncbi:hypothetical protein AURDEDRAFT_117825 [Auricularia subglabra TFB-10046 SS5]|uniref:Uncharacterized protein n=1 Tax=Auricularia subglabra (strain TFB-10046 / SS5) TaxID=717982 RepID=J0WN07_AURST|nr:hypothetical protein AURDEDRAFT_117825 [Auricularia subglabra TFB-10046 SS5]
MDGHVVSSSQEEGHCCSSARSVISAIAVPRVASIGDAAAGKAAMDLYRAGVRVRSPGARRCSIQESALRRAPSSFAHRSQRSRAPLMQDGAKDRLWPPPSTPLGALRAREASSSRSFACGANASMLCIFTVAVAGAAAKPIQPLPRLASGGTSYSTAQPSVSPAYGAAEQFAVTAAPGRPQAQTTSASTLSSRLRRARVLCSTTFSSACGAPPTTSSAARAQVGSTSSNTC